MTSSKLEPQIHQHDFIVVPSIFSLLAFSYCFGSTEKNDRERETREKVERERRERGGGGERLRRKITLCGNLLQRGRELEFNFKVNLIWVGWGGVG